MRIWEGLQEDLQIEPQVAGDGHQHIEVIGKKSRTRRLHLDPRPTAFRFIAKINNELERSRRIIMTI